MPRVKLVMFRESDGSVPLLDWLDTLQPKPLDKCRVWLRRLRDHGHELRRPTADYLRDGIYELRVGLQGVNYRILYFYHGRDLVVACHGLVKERAVPPKEIDKAVVCMNQFGRSPAKHTHEFEG